MESEVTTTEPTGGETTKPTEQMITINNREVPLSQAEQTLKQMEHDLKSGYDKRHQEKMTEATAQVKQMQDALAEDAIYYATHNMDDWRGYMPKTGAHIDLDSVMANVTPKTYEPEPRTQMSEPNAFAENETIREVTNKVSALEQRLAREEAARNDTAKNIVVESLRESQAKFPYANVNSVGERLSHYYSVNGSYPTPDIVRKYMKEEHDFVKAQIDKATSSGKAVQGEGITPKVTGAVPEKDKPKLPRLDDAAGMTSFITKNYS